MREVTKEQTKENLSSNPDSEQHKTHLEKKELFFS